MKVDIELLEYIYENAKMGSTAMDRLCELLNDKDNLIKKDITTTQKGYDKFKKDSEKLLKKEKYHAEPQDKIAEMMSKMGIKKEVKKDNSDAAIAKMVIEGLNMGIVEMESKLKRYKDETDKKVFKIAKDFLKFQKEEVGKYKNYL